MCVRVVHDIRWWMLSKRVTHELLLDVKWRLGWGAGAVKDNTNQQVVHFRKPTFLSCLPSHSWSNTATSFAVDSLPDLPGTWNWPLASFCLTLRLLIFDPRHTSIGAHAAPAYPAVTLTSHLPIDSLFPMTSDPTGSGLQPSGPPPLLHLPPISAPQTDYSVFRIFMRL